MAVSELVILDVRSLEGPGALFVCSLIDLFDVATPIKFTASDFAVVYLANLKVI